MDRVRVGIIGSGGMAHTRATHVAGHANAELACVGSRNVLTARALAERYGIDCAERSEDVLDRPDVHAVFVTTHNDSHADIALAALQRGKHTFVEYPLAMSVADADGLISLARDRRLVLHVGHDQTFVGWQQAIKREAAALGQLLAASSVLCTPTRGGGRSVWRNLKLSGPPFMVGIAYVYYLLDALGDVEWVEGTAEYQGLEESGYYKSSVTTMMAGFAGGGVAHVLYVRGFTVPRDEQEAAMVFTNGFLSYRGYTSGGRSPEGKLTRVTVSGPAEVDIAPVRLAQASQQNTDNFLREIRDGVPVDPPVERARNAVAVALAADEAARRNRRIRVE